MNKDGTQKKGEALVYAIALALERYRDNTYNNNGDDLHLLTATKVSQEKHTRLRSVNHQFRAYCEGQKAYRAAFKESLISYSYKASLLKIRPEI